MKRLKYPGILDGVLPLPLLLGALLLGGCAGNDDRLQRMAAVIDTACEASSDTGTVVVGSGLPGDPAAPEPASGYRVGKQVVHARDFMVTSANPIATKAGCEVLRQGGSAVDAAVAVQAVLGLVEPQSSGLGGGAFMLHYDAATKSVTAYDGRETAPAAATQNHLRWIDDTSKQSAPLPSTRASGRSIGTPGVVRLLELAHQEHGKRPWAELFQPGIRLAEQGFPISGRMADAIAASATHFLRDADAAAAYLNPDRSPKTLGTILRLPAYADTLRAIAAGGANAFYSGPIAQAIVDEINATASAADGSPITPGKATLADLSGYQAKKREAVCTTYRAHWICGMPPPSSGGITVASALGILENFDLAELAPRAVNGEGGTPNLMAVHLVSEAERLAYADRDKYIADTDFVPLPGGSPAMMLDKDYLKQRAGLIRAERSMGTAEPGDLGPVPLGSDRTPESGTTHFTIVDREGNVVSMTTTVEASFGSWRMVRGFVLNNQLTDFSAVPTDSNGTPIANRVAPGKRPRSSMAPTLVFAKARDGSRGDFVMATGSPGGSTIIQYVVKTLVAALDWGLDAQQATSMVNFGAANSPTTHVGGEHPAIDETSDGNADPLVTGLRKLGHAVSVNAQTSGVSTIVRKHLDGRPVLAGGADPRREGLVLGGAVMP